MKKLSQRAITKLVDQATIEKFGPALYFKIVVAIPKELPHTVPEHSTREKERQEIAKNWALWKLRRTKEYKYVIGSFGEAAVTRQKYGGAYEVIVVFRWG